MPLLTSRFICLQRFFPLPPPLRLAAPNRQQPGVAVTDVATGLLAHGAILTALIARDKTGVGRKIECSLFESQLAMLANVGANALMTGDPGSRLGTAHKVSPAVCASVCVCVCVASVCPHLTP